MFFFSKKNNRNGFTLIELLAVIVVLAIIALIAIPVVQDIVKHAKKEVLRDTAYGLAQAGQNKCSSSTLQGTWDETLVQFENNEETSEAKLSDYFKGKNPDAGEVSINDSCKTAIAIWNDSVKTCAYKGYSDDKVALISMKNSNTCKLEESGDLDDDYVDTSSTGYLCANPGSTVATDSKYFTFNQTTKTITGYSVEGPKDLIIPCTIGGVNVEIIADSAFKGKGLTSVLMPDTVKIINNAAFQNNSITSVSFGKSVESIGYQSFNGNLLTEVIFPDSLKVTSPGCGGGCTVFSGSPITKVTFGTGIETIGDGLFAGTSTLMMADLSRANKLKSIGNVAFSGTKLTELNVNTTNALTINSGAFTNSKLISLTINSPSTTIGTTAFQNNLLASISLLGKTVSIGADAFKNNQMPDEYASIYGRNADGTVNSTLVSYAGANRNSITLPDTVTSVNATFNGLGMNGTFNTGNGLTNISNSMFASNSLTNVIIGNAVTTIGDSAFKNNMITSVVIGNGVKIINNAAFQNNKITSLNLGNSVESIGYQSFNGNLLTEVTFPDSLKVTSPGCGGGCTVFSGNPITKATFGSGMETIGDGLFLGISTLTTVDLSRTDKLKSIGNVAFSGTKLTELNVNTTNALTINSGAFADSKLTSLTINSPSTTIGTTAFQNNLLTSINLLGKTVSIGADAFKNNQMPDEYASIYGRNADGTVNSTLVSYAGANRNSITLPDTVTSVNATFNGLGMNGTFNTGNGLTNISNSMFASNSLTNVIIGNAVTTIGDSAFKNNMITSVVIGNGVKIINNAAFQNNKITSLNLGNSVESIGYQSFNGNLLTEVTFPDSLKVTSPGCGGGCTVFSGNPITKATFGSGMETIGDGLFLGISTLTTVDLSRIDKLKSIGNVAFSGTSLTELNVSTTNALTINSGAFANSKLTSLTINSPSTTIGTTAFQNNLLTSINLLGQTVSIGADAFKNNQMPDEYASIYGRNADGTVNSTLVSYAGANRNSITLPDTVTSVNATFNGLGMNGTFNTGNGLTNISNSMFASNSLTNVIIGNAVTTIGDSAFKNNMITSVVIGNGVKIINNAAFQNNKITSLNLGNSVESIGYQSFNGNLLTEVTFPDSLKVTSPGCGGGCTVFSGNPITKATFGSGMETIGDGLFLGISTLTTVDLSRSNKLKSIGYAAFSGTKISTVEIPPSVLTLSSDVFANNASLIKIIVKGKANASNFTSLGANWNGSCSNIIYELDSCYTYSGNTITDYNIACSKNVEIPSTLGGNTITTIGSNAFASKGLTKVRIPSTVTNIGVDAFNNNTIQPIIVLGKSSSSDFSGVGTNWDGGNHILYENNQYTCLRVTNNIIDGFYNESFCSRSITIPSNITGVTSTAFSGILLDSITVANGTRLSTLGTGWNGTTYKINFLGDSYDYNCFTLSGSKITGYKQYCSATVDLTKTVQGTTITEIGTGAFLNAAINVLILSGNITNIESRAFENNDITSIDFVDGLVTIGDKAFYNTGLLTLTLPSTLQNIGANAFAANAGLTQININGKTSSAGFTSLGTGWNGTCNHIVYNG
jgi:prepilin-type N-terminal cleavage/methylation domain-containing protein